MIAAGIGRLRGIADLRDRARARLPRAVFEYLDGGAEDETSLRRAVADFDTMSFVPRVLNDVDRISRQTRLFGRDCAAPLMLSPTGLSGLYDPGAEAAVARAAAAAGICYALSTLSTLALEAIPAGGPRLMQVYVFRDRGLTKDMVERARAAGYDGLVLTVDTPVGGNRERDHRNGMSVPPKFTPATLIDFALHPGWSLPALARPQRFAFGNLAGTRPGGKGAGPSVAAFVNSQFDRSLTWRDVEWLADLWQGPLAVKGILQPEDAEAAVAAGADTIIVSHHGGRQLDGAVSPFRQLAPVCDAVRHRATVICDGGIRRGSHVAKAMAMGAHACSIGRPYLYGLAAGGEAGVSRAIAILVEEFDRCLRLLGVADASKLDRTHLVADGTHDGRLPSA